MNASKPAPLPGPPLHGWLVVDKPVGIGSTAVVSAVKRALREGGYAKVKVGHGGTLDPLASGVLPIALGEATKLAGRMLDADKAYDFTIQFGEETDTLDREGSVVARSDWQPAFGDIGDVLGKFRGEIEQVPPAFSAIKVAGSRAYDLARSGLQPKLVPRVVTVHELQGAEDRERLWTQDDPDERAKRHVDNEGARLQFVTLSACVSKGTYIRSLARDIAYALGTVGHVTMLRRTRAGPFTLASAISLDKMRDLAMGQALEQALLPLTSALDDIPALPVTPDQASALRQGRTIGTTAEPGLCFAMLDTVPIALAEVSEGELRVVRGLNL